MDKARQLDWQKTSWYDKTILQQPKYPDEAALNEVLSLLSRLPPLVTSWEVRRLKRLLAEATYGKRFLLQGGDCAESFSECTAQVVTSRLKILLQMSLVLIHGLQKPVIRVGRFAGQYAKPRSSDTETRNGVTLPSYRGDIINSPEFTAVARTPDPQRLFQGYSYAAMTLNLVRSLAEGGFADLHHPEYWDLAFVKHSPRADEYNVMVHAIGDAVCFLETISDLPLKTLERVFIHTSHEALHLAYEQALTRFVPHQVGAYNLSTHFPWIGLRTAHINGAHIEYARGIQNPIGIKIGPQISPSTLKDIILSLDPDDEPGRLTLIHRFGADAIGSHLPTLIKTVQKTGKKVLWSCDPMHGNTEETATGRKTRHFDNILAELEQAFDIHASMGSFIGGVHFELTGENVTECIGGARGLEEAELEHAYKSQVDPRLNYEQAMEMAFLVVRKSKRLAK